MKSLGKQNILIHHIYQGNPVLSIVNQRTVYERKNGTFFAKFDKRYEVTKVPPRCLSGPKGPVVEYEMISEKN